MHVENRPAAVAVLEPARNPVESFRAALEAREMAPGSVRLYLAALRRLEAAYGPLLSLGTDELRSWLSGMKEAGLAPPTRSSRLAAVREFFGWAAGAGLIPVSPFQGQKEFSVRRKDYSAARTWKGLEASTVRLLGKYLGSEAVADPTRRASFTLPDGRVVLMSDVALKASELRDRALLWVLLASGMRASEAASINVSDLSAEGGHTIGRLLGKGGKERPFVLGLAATAGLAAYLNYRDALAPSSDRLFVTDAGTPFHPKKVWNVIARVLRAAGVTQKLSPHSFRHARADELLERSKGDLALVAETLGHASLETTRGYLAKNPKLLRGRLAAIGGLD